MIYGVVCFAILFSFVGTVLGGLWADNSWGRFWGWDPKENGALIIVIWNALVLQHARWGGMVKERGTWPCWRSAGIIAVTWSGFGVNELGVGLHAYGGSTAKTVITLLAVGASQLAIIAIGALLPKHYWASFRRSQSLRLRKWSVKRRSARSEADSGACSCLFRCFSRQYWPLPKSRFSAQYRPRLG